LSSVLQKKLIFFTPSAYCMRLYFSLHLQTRYFYTPLCSSPKFLHRL